MGKAQFIITAYPNGIQVTDELVIKTGVPVDVTDFAGGRSAAAYSTEAIIEKLENAGKHVAVLMYDDYYPSDHLSLWFSRELQHRNYKPRHRGEGFGVK